MFRILDSKIVNTPLCNHTKILIMQYPQNEDNKNKLENTPFAVRLEIPYVRGFEVEIFEWILKEKI